MKPLLCCAVLLWAMRGEAGEFRAGAAVIRITPDQPLPLAGYYSTRLSEGVHDDLHAKALVLEQDGISAALVVCDLITMPRAVVEQARALIEKQTGLPGERVMISATHTHTGPVLHTGTSRAQVDSSGTNTVLRYTAELPAAIARSVSTAFQRLTPARSFAGLEQETKLSFNRRYFMEDGSVGWNPGKRNPKIVRPAGLIDPDVAVVYFESSPTNPLATYVNFAMHPDTVGGLQISADYPFTLSRILAELRGSNMVTLFANGTCGDINHVNVNSSDPQKGHAEAARIGTILAGDVLKAFTQLRPLRLGPPVVRSAMVELALPAVTEDDLARAREIIARLGSRTPPKFLDQVFAFKVLDVAARRGQPHQVEVQVVAVGGDLAWVSLPGEIFVELGRQIKTQSPFRQTLIAELANGAIGYIPTKTAFEQGNYEPVSARCAAGSGERLVTTALKLLREAKAATKVDNEPSRVL